jgi:uncharacterized protein YdiU (UPF0061 family)
VKLAAVVTRVAPSFIRFGHFEHFAYREQLIALRTLADHVIDRFYPACRDTSALGGNRFAALLQAVSERTAQAGGPVAGCGLLPWRHEHRQHEHPRA